MPNISPTIRKAVMGCFRSRLQDCKNKQSSHIYDILLGIKHLIHVLQNSIILNQYRLIIFYYQFKS